MADMQAIRRPTKKVQSLWPLHAAFLRGRGWLRREGSLVALQYQPGSLSETDRLLGNCGGKVCMRCSKRHLPGPMGSEQWEHLGLRPTADVGRFTEDGKTQQ
jgi:hypothetical protein